MALFSDALSRVCQTLELSSGLVHVGDLKDDTGLERKLKAMGTPELKGLHEASTAKSEKKRQAVIVVVTSRWLGKDPHMEDVEMSISALNGVTGTLRAESSAARHQFMQKGPETNYWMGQVLLLFAPDVRLDFEERENIKAGKITKNTRGKVELVVDKQSQIVHLGRANGIERCGATTKKGTECKIAVDKQRSTHCHFHGHGDAVFSQAYQEASNEINLVKNKEGLTNVENQNRQVAGTGTADGSGGVSGKNSILARRTTAPTSRDDMAANLIRGTTHRKENVAAGLSHSILRGGSSSSAGVMQRQTHEGTHSASGAVAMPYNGPTSATSVSMGQGAQSAAIKRAGIPMQKVDSVQAVGTGAGAAGGGAGGSKPSSSINSASGSRAAGASKRAPGISDASGLGEEETEQEKALLGTSGHYMDGQVKVPSQSKAFSAANEMYRRRVVGTGSGGGRIASAREQNGILNGKAGAARQAEQDRRRHGSDRQFNAQSKISQEHANRQMSAEQIKRRKVGAEGMRQTQEEALRKQKEVEKRAFHRGYAMSGGVLVDQRKLNANAESYAPPKQKAAQAIQAVRVKRKKEEEDAEIDALLNRKSAHAEEEEDEWMEDFQAKMKKLEAQEYYAVKANEATFIKIAAFHCVNCDFTSEDSPALCRSKGHLVKMTKATKRYFECRSCPTSRTHTMGALVPSKTCQQCGKLSWKMCGSRGSGATGGTFGGSGKGNRPGGLTLSGSDYTTRNDTDGLASRARDLDRM